VTEPILYVKRGCPYCGAAINYLNQRQITYREVDVVGNGKAMQELKNVSGQIRTPTMVWDGEVLADFGVEELEAFLTKRGIQAGK
jgi:glutaredoxin 3